MKRVSLQGRDRGGHPSYCYLRGWRSHVADLMVLG